MDLINGTKSEILLFIKRNPNCVFDDVNNNIEKAKSTISTHLTDLEKEDLIIRTCKKKDGILQGRKKIRVNKDKLRFESRINEFTIEFIPYFLSILITLFISVFLGWKYYMFLGGIISISIPFSYKLYDLIKTEDYLKVYKR